MAETQTEVKIPTKEEILNGESTQQRPAPESGKAATGEPSYTAVELEAIKQGWKPKSEWDGDPDQHRSAREYLDRGELLGKIKSQSSQLEEMRRAIGAMSEHNKKVYQAGYEKALTELKARKITALKEGDAELVLALDDEIDKTKDAIREVRNTTVQLPRTSTETADWLARNKWYATDAVAHAAADELARQYARSHPNCTEADIYEYIDAELPKELPHKFGKKQNQSAPDPEGESRRGSGNGGSKGGTTTFEKLLDTMTSDQAQIAKTLVKTGAITKEEYVKQYNQMMGA